MVNKWCRWVNEREIHMMRCILHTHHTRCVTPITPPHHKIVQCGDVVKRYGGIDVTNGGWGGYTMCWRRVVGEHGGGDKDGWGVMMRRCDKGGDSEWMVGRYCAYTEHTWSDTVCTEGA